MKRSRVDEDTDLASAAKKARLDQRNHTSEAAKFNGIVLRKLQKALAVDPETDLQASFPTGYSARLTGRKKQDDGKWTFGIFPEVSLIKQN